MLLNAKRVVVLIGRKQSGKDYLADVIVQSVKTNIIRESFAAPLKETLKTLFNLPNINFFNDQESLILEGDC